MQIIRNHSNRIESSEIVKIWYRGSVIIDPIIVDLIWIRAFRKILSDKTPVRATIDSGTNEKFGKRPKIWYNRVRKSKN